jgi:hypothetical protein
MKRFALIWAALLLFVSSGAFGQDVRYNFDKDADFSKFKTYEWVLIKGASQADDLTDKQIKAAVDAQLTTKGLTRTDGDNDISACWLVSHLYKQTVVGPVAIDSWQLKLAAYPTGKH